MAESESPACLLVMVPVAFLGFMAIVSATGSWSNAEEAKSKAALVTAYSGVVQASCSGDLTEANRAKACAAAMDMLKRVR